MKLSIEYYKIFYQVALHSSFSKAAEQLFVSQSAVSQSIRNLEKHFGFSLFLRTTKKVVLTPNGKAFYDEVKRALFILQQAEQRLIQQNNPDSGLLTIGSTDTLCKYFLLEHLKKMIIHYPALKIKIINATSLECLNLLGNAQIDLAVVNLPAQLEKCFTVQQAYSFQDQFVVHADSPLPQKITLAEIAQQPLLLLDKKSITRGYLDTLFAEKDIEIKPEIELQNIDLLVEMLQIGLGLSFIPNFCLTGKKLKILDIATPIPMRQFGIVALKEWPLSPMAHRFIDICHP